MLSGDTNSGSKWRIIPSAAVFELQVWKLAQWQRRGTYETLDDAEAAMKSRISEEDDK